MLSLKSSSHRRRDVTRWSSRVASAYVGGVKCTLMYSHVLILDTTNLTEDRRQFTAFVARFFIPPYGSMVGIFSLLWRSKFPVTLFSYIVWPTAMKFGVITDIGA